MYVSLIDKTEYLDKIWVKTFKSKEDMVKWLYNSVTHAEDDLYKVVKLTYTIAAKPGCTFLDTHYFEEDDFNIPIKDFFNKLKEACKDNKDNIDEFVSTMNNIFMEHHKHRIKPINYIELTKEDVENMSSSEKSDFYRSFHHSSSKGR